MPPFSVTDENFWKDYTIDLDKISQLIKSEQSSLGSFTTEEILEKLKEANNPDLYTEYQSLVSNTKLPEKVFQRGDQKLISAMNSFGDYILKKLANNDKIKDQIGDLKDRYHRLVDYLFYDRHNNRGIAVLLKESIEYFVRLLDEEPDNFIVKNNQFPPTVNSNFWVCPGGVQSRLYIAQAAGGNQFFNRIMNEFISRVLVRGLPNMASPWRIYEGNQVHGVSFGHFCLGSETALIKKDHYWSILDMDLHASQIESLMRAWPKFLKSSITDEFKLLFNAIEREVENHRKKNRVLYDQEVLEPINQESALCKALNIASEMKTHIIYEDDLFLKPSGINYQKIIDDVLVKIAKKESKQKQLKQQSQQLLFCEIYARRGRNEFSLYQKMKPLLVEQLKKSDMSIMPSLAEAYPEDKTLMPLSELQKTEMERKIIQIIEKAHKYHFGLLQKNNVYPPPPKELPNIFMSWMSNGASLKELTELYKNYKTYLTVMPITSLDILAYKDDGLAIIKEFHKIINLNEHYSGNSNHWFRNMYTAGNHNLMGSLIIGYHLGGISFKNCSEWLKFFGKSFPSILKNASNDGQILPIHMVAKWGDGKLMKELLDQLGNKAKEYINRPVFNETPLMIAVKAENVETVAFLTNNDANILYENEIKDTAFHYAISSNVKILKELMNQKAENHWREKDRYKELILLAIKKGAAPALDYLLTLFVKKNNDLKTDTTFEKDTLRKFFKSAVNFGSLGSIKLLIEKKWIHINERLGTLLKSPLIYVLSGQKPTIEIVKYLVEKAKVDLLIADKDDNPAIIHAAKSNRADRDIFEYLHNELIKLKQDNISDNTQNNDEKDEKEEKEEKEEKATKEDDHTPTSNTRTSLTIKQQINNAFQILFTKDFPTKREKMIITFLFNSSYMDINYIGKNGTTHFMAICNSNVDDDAKKGVIGRLTENRDAPPTVINQTDTNGNTALLYALKKNCFATTTFLIESFKADINISNTDSDTALSIACSNEDQGMTVNFLKEKKAYPNDPKALYNSVKLAKDNTVSELLKILVDGYKADVNSTSKDGKYSALRAAIEVHDSSPAVFIYLLEKKLSIDPAKGLFLAAEHHNLPLIHYFLSLPNADINARDEHRRGVLHIYINNIKTTDSFDGKFRTLLDNGANIYLKDDNGRTPLMSSVLCIDGEFLEELIARHKENTNHKKEGSSSDEKKFSKDALAFYDKDYLDAQDNEGYTALALSTAYDCQLSCLETLIDEGANHKILTNKLESVLILYIRNKSISSKHMLTLLYMLKKGVEVNQVDDENQTALDILIAKDALPETIESDPSRLVALNILLRYGANIRNNAIEFEKLLLKKAKEGHDFYARVLIGAGYPVSDTFINNLSGNDQCEALRADLNRVKKNLQNLLVQLKSKNNKLNLVSDEHLEKFQGKVVDCWLVPGLLKQLLSDKEALSNNNTNNKKRKLSEEENKKASEAVLAYCLQELKKLLHEQSKTEPDLYTAYYTEKKAWLDKIHYLINWNILKHEKMKEKTEDDQIHDDMSDIS